MNKVTIVFLIIYSFGYISCKNNSLLFSTEIIPEIIAYLRGRKGPVAQLNRASDSGSAGRGFESHRGHKISSRKRDCFFVTHFLFLFRYAKALTP